MIRHIPRVLTREEVADFRRTLQAAAWADGRITAGPQSAAAKRNLQLPEDAPEAALLGERILDRLGGRADFLAAALPARVFPPLFNRYEAGMGFGAHVDNAIRVSGPRAARYRTDLSCTLFLSDPDEYEGGELVIEDRFGAPAVKLPAGDLVLYPASSVHRVTEVTRGARWAAFFWVQSMVRDDGRRQLLFDLDRSIGETRTVLGDENAAVIRLTGAYHNLVRMWAEG